MTRKQYLYGLVLIFFFLAGCSKYPNIEYSEIPIPENTEQDTVGYPIELPWNHGQYPELLAGTTFTEGPYKGYEIIQLWHYIIDDKSPDTAGFYKDNLLPLGWELIEESNSLNRYGTFDNILVWKRGKQIIYIVTYQHPLANMGNETTLMGIGLFAK